MSKYYHDHKAGERPINFIERYCTHTQGPLMGQLIELMDFHKNMIREVFGAKRQSDGLRRYTFVYQEIPKKNAKSTILAALGLYMTGYDGEMGGEVAVVAGGKEQAQIIHNSAKQMVEQNEHLSKVFEVYTDAIHHRKTNSVFRVMSSDSGTKHGPNLSCVIFDELHVQKNGELWDTLTKGVAARLQPLVFALTTAGYKGTFAEEISNAAYRIYQGVDNSEFWFTQFFGIRNEQEALKVYMKESAWREANPGYGITVSKTYFRTQMEEIKKRPSALTGFLRLHLNVWTGTAVSWDILPYLGGCNQRHIDEKDFEGRVCFAGLDLAKKGDTSAAFYLFPDETGKKFDVICRVWIPEATLQARVEKENANWREWVADGWVRVTPGGVVEQDIILADILEDSKKFVFYEDDLNPNEPKPGFLCDPYAAWQLVPKMQAFGLPADMLAQNPRNLCPPFAFLEKCIIEGSINFAFNPVLSWQCTCVQVTTYQHDNTMASKKDSNSRIDLISAATMAFAAFLPTTVDRVPQKSIYEDPELWKD